MAIGSETPNQTLNQAYQEILNQYTVPYLQNLATELETTGPRMEEKDPLFGRPLHPFITQNMIDYVKSGNYIESLGKEYGLRRDNRNPDIGVFEYDDDMPIGDISFLEDYDISNIDDIPFKDESKAHFAGGGYSEMYGTDPTQNLVNKFDYKWRQGDKYPIPGDRAYTKGGYNFYERNYPGRNIIKRDNKIWSINPQSGHQTLIADLTTEDPRVSGIPFIPTTVHDIHMTSPVPHFKTQSELPEIADAGTEGSYSTFERAEEILGEEIQGQELFNIGRETAKFNEIKLDLTNQLNAGAVTQEQYDQILNDLFNIHKAEADKYMLGRGFSEAGSDVSGIDEANIMNEILGLDEVDLNTFPEE